MAAAPRLRAHAFEFLLGSHRPNWLAFSPVPLFISAITLACAEFPAIDNAPSRIVGVATVGRPVSRNLADGWTAEVTRVCVLPAIGNGCSLLYGACWRAARAMGYRRLVTYTLPSEGGASLRASNAKCIGEAGGGSWSRSSRPRVDRAPTQVKMRWEWSLDAEDAE